MTDDSNARDELLAAAAAFADLLATDRHYRVAPSDDRTFRICFPLANRALAQVRAALTLIERGLEAEASANARVAYEHALVAQWVHLTDGGAVAVLRQIQGSHHKLVLDYSRLAPVDDEQLAPFAELDGSVRGYTIEAICKRFDLSYSMYRDLSANVHPSSELLAEHIHMTAEGDVDQISTRPILRSGKVPRVLALSAGLAAHVLEDLEHPSSRRSEVATVAERFGVPVDLAASDTKTHLHRDRS